MAANAERQEDSPISAQPVGLFPTHSGRSLPSVAMSGQPLYPTLAFARGKLESGNSSWRGGNRRRRAIGRGLYFLGLLTDGRPVPGRLLATRKPLNDVERCGFGVEILLHATQPQYRAGYRLIGPPHAIMLVVRDAANQRQHRRRSVYPNRDLDHADDRRIVLRAPLDVLERIALQALTAAGLDDCERPANSAAKIEAAACPADTGETPHRIGGRDEMITNFLGRPGVDCQQHRRRRNLRGRGRCAAVFAIGVVIGGPAGQNRSRC